MPSLLYDAILNGWGSKENLNFKNTNWPALYLNVSGAEILISIIPVCMLLMLFTVPLNRLLMPVSWNSVITAHTAPMITNACSITPPTVPTQPPLNIVAKAWNATKR